ncbi:hypothetical protein CHARACLAT_024418 [Characodon lateralis]|uniref:Uncharacterized protein n=1 Tax=Characodon lateralis TaxID=208331 RepID=A0ABU7DBX4_9TELE|nr:hypothetical protein [Characodon lateralis]
MIKTIYVLRTSLPISCLRLDSHQARSFLLPPSPGPSRKRTLSTLHINICTPNSFLFAPSSHRTAPKEPSTNSTSTNLVPESFYQWRPDHNYLLENHPLCS